MLVVVYLIDARKNVIIPQNWIMGSNQENINNFGKASYQTRRIFWSKIGIDCESIPDVSIVPNFRLPLAKVFPPPTDAVCYFARIRRFCSTRDRAICFRNSFRSILPIRYCSRRRSDESTPPLSPNHNDTLPLSPNHTPPLSPNHSDTPPTPIQNYRIDLNAINTDASTSSQSLLLTQNNTLPSLTQNDQTDLGSIASPIASTSSQNAPINQDENDEIQSNQSTDQELKIIMPDVQLQLEDSNVIGELFDSYDDGDSDDNHRSDDENSHRQPFGITLASNETAFYDDDGVLKIKTKYDNDCEFVHVYGAQIRPKVPEYQVKLNDILSENIPFKENGNGDRAYMVDTKEGIKEVLLSVRAVNGLKQLNSEEKRTAQRYDMSFIKALLVSFIGVRQLKEQGVDSDILKLIKNFFIIRIGKDDNEEGSRYLAFNDLAGVATEEIQRNF